MFWFGLIFAMAVGAALPTLWQIGRQFWYFRRASDAMRLTPAQMACLSAAGGELLRRFRMTQRDWVRLGEAVLLVSPNVVEMIGDGTIPKERALGHCIAAMGDDWGKFVAQRQ